MNIDILSLAAAVARGGEEEHHRRSLAVIASALPAGAISPLHAHAHDEAVHVSAGQLVVRLGHDTITLEPGDGLLLPAGVPHAFEASAGGARVVTATAVVSVSSYEEFLQAVLRPRYLRDRENWLGGDDAMRLGVIGAANGIAVLAPPGVPIPAAA